MRAVSTCPASQSRARRPRGRVARHTRLAVFIRDLLCICRRSPRSGACMSCAVRVCALIYISPERRRPDARRRRPHARSNTPHGTDRRTAHGSGART